MNKVKHCLKGELSIIIFCLMAWTSNGQEEIQIKGKVMDALNHFGIESANVQLYGSNRATATNVLGEFSLLIPNTFPCTLSVSYIGFATQEIELQGDAPLMVFLEEIQKELDEVVIESGYSVQKKREFSGSVSNIDRKQLMCRPALSFDQLLGAQTPGIDLIQPTSVLNNTPIIRIRGINTITSGLFPLVVVDGVSVFVGSIGGLIGNNPLSDINPSDIQSIDILKDASAAAIYGSRAANGVMVIRTRQGKKGRVKVNYDTWLSRSTPYNLPKLLNAEDYTMIKNEAMVNSGREPGYHLMYNPDGSVVNTNWYDVAYRPGYSHNQNISISGANNSTNYFFSTGYTYQNSFIRYNSYERYSTRFNLDNQTTSWLKLGGNAAYSQGLNTGPNTGAITSNTLSSSSYNSEYITNEPLGRMTYVLPPNVPVYNADGSYAYQNRTSVGYGANNPATIGTINAYNLAMVQKLDVTTSQNNTLIGSVFAEAKITPKLTFKTSLGINLLQNEYQSFLNPLHGGGASANGVATNSTTRYDRSDWINTLQYQTNVRSDHSLSVLLGYEQIKTEINGWGAQRSNITDLNYTNYQGGYINISPYGNIAEENALISYFSNINYAFNKTYLLSINARRDGLSALAEGNKFGNFGGLSLGWVISNETFYSNSIFSTITDHLKFRASYGIVGNSEIGNYPAIGAYTSNTYGGSPTLNYAQSANPDLKWETSTKLNLGFDGTLLKERLGVSFDFFRNEIKDLILKAPQALSAGIPGNYININVGSMYNTGIELALYGNLINKSDFKWDFNFSFSTLKNKVTSLISDVYVPSIFGVQNMTREGYSIGSIFAVPTKGVNPDNGLMVFINNAGEEVQYNHIGTPRWTYLDGTPAPAIDNYRDGKIQGPSLPTFYGGITNTFSYKNFDLSIHLSYVGGNKLYNGTRATNSDQRYFNNGEFIKERWTKPGQITEIQKLYYGDNVSAGFSFAATSKVENGDYLKLKSITLGYNLPVNQGLLKGKVSSVRFYVQGINLYTLTEYRGSDPEVSINGNSIHSGKDQNVSPNAQTLSIGMNIGF